MSDHWQTSRSCSWLQDTLKIKLVDFAWNPMESAIFSIYPARPCLLSGLKVSINPIFFFYKIRGACFLSIVGSSSGKPGKQERGGAKKIKK